MSTSERSRRTGRAADVTRRAQGPTTSRNTWQAVYSMFGPMAVANFTMLLVIVVFVVFQPKASDPSTYWAIALMAVLMLIAGVLMVKGMLRLRLVRKSHKEDRRRIAAGLTLEPERDDD
jgi:membrane protein YdbS with pleckstrin-like domain